MERRQSIAETEVVYDSDDSSIKTSLLQQYSGRCRWLKDQGFLRELEGDSVDTEILDEELRSIQDEEPKHCRGKTLKLLESNPFQIVLCVLVLVDAGVVIAEIMLDLHAIRSQLTEAEASMTLAGNYLKAFYSNDLHGSHYDNLDDILAKIQHSYSTNKTVVELRIFEHCEELIAAAHSSEPFHASQHHVLHRNTSNSSDVEHDTEQDAHRSQTKNNTSIRSKTGTRTTQPNHPESGNDPMQKHRPQTVDDSESSRHQIGESNRTEDTLSPLALSSKSSGAAVGTAQLKSSSDGTEAHLDGDPDHSPKSKHKYTYAEKLLKIAHVLHYCSIGILGLFVLQVVVKMYGMGLEFFRQKMEVFDAVIICASFALDLVFLNGVGSAQGEEAAALLIVFLLWRLLRVINGLMVTAKKRQEFRIKLQKRARRKAEKRIETLEEEKRLKEEELKAIKELCKEKGASDVEVSKCKPRKNIFQKMDTSAGLSSIAALSLGFGMSMSTSRMATSPALSRHTKLPAVHGKKGEIKLQNLMLRVGVVQETDTKSTSQLLSVPKHRNRRSPSTSPKGSPQSSPSPISFLEKPLIPCNNSKDHSKGKLKKQDSLVELVSSDRNGNINVNQNNSYSDYSDAESETEKAVHFREVVDLHIKCSEPDTVSVGDTTKASSLPLDSNRTDSCQVSSANRCSTSTEVGVQRTLTASVSISDENVNRNGSCQSKRVIFATMSHPHASKSHNMHKSDCDVDQIKALDSVGTVKSMSECDNSKECLVNGRVTTELSEEFSHPQSPHIGVQ